ncbi:MAG: indolepyruvate ferredoxin oxidoreductase [Planctomycetes bacterium]|nr:indolepyruvate ferredoxin oxidoreductase [Planctomycetota bacterium]MBI3832857.1 indolepyruvate ferredoxin oxidoreductase [Planctomycetota bacterium]
MELLLGDEAVGVAAIDAGISGAFSYPGTPATEIFECIEERSRKMNGAERPAIAARWSANEKIAFEEALGMSYVGRRAIVSMKHVGLNVAADPLMSSALTGANGGLVVVVADDPGMHSSQNEQDTRCYADFARLPLFEPSTQQEAYDLTREAFALSERLGTPVMIRMVTRLAHSEAPVARRAANVPPADRARGNTNDWVLLPPNARRRNRRVIDLQPELRGYSERCPANRLKLNGSRGVIACGIANNYFLEAIGDDPSYSILKLCVSPIPTNLIKRLVNHCDEILVLEDGYPFVETRIMGLMGVPGKTIAGRLSRHLPPDGELSVDLVRKAISMLWAKGDAASNSDGAVERSYVLPPRPPCLCQGCPHCDTFQVLVDALGGDSKPYLFSDIGCYTLGAYPPYNAVHTCVEMGASIGMALGAAKAGVSPVICTIGDSTFIHSGLGTMIAAAAENANMTVIIMDNSGIAMTGGQEPFVTGEQFIRLLRGLGVDARRIFQIDPIRKEHDANVRLLQREIAYPGLSVIVSSRPCIHMKRRATLPAGCGRSEDAVAV